MDEREATARLNLPEGRWVDVDGPVHYREWTAGGDGGATFVCVHGLGGSSLNWSLVAPGLARMGRVLAPDLAGFGLTPAAGRGTGVGANRRLLDGLLRALDLPPAVLVGNSMGGMLTLIQAAHAPATVDAMILVDAAFPRPTSFSRPASPRVAVGMAVSSSERLGTWLMSARGRRLGAEGVVRETLRLCTADPASMDPALVALMVDQVRRRQDDREASLAFIHAARSILQAHVRPGPYRSLVRRADRPALVLHGARDRLVPVASAVAAARGHANWTAEVFPDLGHLPMMEAPGRWLVAVERWLDGRARDSAIPRSAAAGSVEA